MIVKASSLDELLIFVGEIRLLQQSCLGRVPGIHVRFTCVIRHGEREAPGLLTHNIDMEYNILLDFLSVILKL